MELEQQVVSLKLAKKLKELGVPQESLFVWYQTSVLTRQNDDPNSSAYGTWKSMGIQWKLDDWAIASNDMIDSKEWYPAYTVAELGELLPTTHQSIKTYRRHLGECVCRWDYGISPTGKHEETADTEANVRAKMLIYLIENNFLT